MSYKKQFNKFDTKNLTHQSHSRRRSRSRSSAAESGIRPRCSRPEVIAELIRQSNLSSDDSHDANSYESSLNSIREEPTNEEQENEEQANEEQVNEEQVNEVQVNEVQATEVLENDKVILQPTKD